MAISSENKFYAVMVICILLFVVGLIITTTISGGINVNYNLTINMDNNTLEAVKSIDWTAVQ